MSDAQSQCLFLIIVRNSQILWGLSLVYASPTASVREGLWQCLCSLCGFVLLPWLMMGDFNQVLELEDKRGGSQRLWSNAKKLWNSSDVFC